MRVTADLLKRRQLVICDTCADCLQGDGDLLLGRQGASGTPPERSRTTPWTIMRYFAMDLAAAGERGGFAATWVERRA